MLQRIYGTSWANQKDLDEYLKRIEEAEKRDHRKLGKEMDLFHFREESPGSVFWHEKGWLLFQRLVEYMRAKQRLAGYKEIKLLNTLKKRVRHTKQNLLKQYQKMKMCLFIFMVIGMTYVEALTFPQLEKLENILN